ncbi:DUF2635 domain-containing protein [Rhizobium sp. CRIBSB]|nr:DUF2635 domain-containing protein [Rhizobium sp. CRIBSB]
MTEPETLFLIPGPDRRVRHPDGRLLDAAGEWVTASPYWSRKWADGDVAPADAPQDDAPEATPPQPTPPRAGRTHPTSEKPSRTETR